MKTSGFMPSIERFALLTLFTSLLVPAAGAQNLVRDLPEGKPLGPGNYHLKLESGSQERTFTVHVPPASRDKKQVAATQRKGIPLLVVLHGAGGSGDQAAADMDWDKKADKEEFVAVFPDALPANPKQPSSFQRNPRFWEDGFDRGAEPRGKIDDLAFLTAVIDDVEKRCPIDSRRVYLTGFSSGASMTFSAVASPLSKRITAAAPVSGHLWAKEAHPERAVPLLLIFGTKDPLNPMEGGSVRMPWGGSQVRPRVADTVAAWAKASGCPPEAAPLKDENGIKSVAYGPGRDGAEFVFVTVDGMGHVWPSGKERLPENLVGPRTDKLNATDRVWTFLSRHYLSDRESTPIVPQPRSSSAPTVPTPTGVAAPAAPTVPEKKP